MRIAVAADQEMINPSFGETRNFRLYEAEGDRVTRELSVPALGEGPEELTRALSDYRVNVLICGALSGSARVALGKAGILVFGGIIGRAGNAVEALLRGTLNAQGKADCAEDCSGSCSAESCKNCQFKN